MKLTKTKLAMMIFEVWSNTVRDYSLEEWINHYLRFHHEFECKVREGKFSLEKNHKLIKLLIETEVLKLVKNATGGKGVKVGACYRFNPTFKELCLNKDDLIDTLKEML